MPRLKAVLRDAIWVDLEGLVCFYQMLVIQLVVGPLASQFHSQPNFITNLTSLNKLCAVLSN